MMSETHRLKLRTVLGDYPHTKDLKSGVIQNDQVELAFTEIAPIHKAFAPMARHQNYDVCEMAIVTYLQAKAYNKPVVLLPIVVAARAQQGCIIYNSKFGKKTVDDLVGARVGVRAYTQTTGMWVRGILGETYNVPLEKVQWVTFEGAHLEEYHDPAFVKRATSNQKMLEMLTNGELDAAIFGNDLPKDEIFKPLIPNAAAADRDWIQKHKFVPTNHVVVMREDIIKQHPTSYHAVFDLLKRGISSSDPSGTRGLDTGVEALRKPLELVVNFCERQELLPRSLSVHEILEAASNLLRTAAV